MATRSDVSIRPFSVGTTRDDLEYLHDRLDRTRWTDALTDAGRDTRRIARVVTELMKSFFRALR